MNLAIKYIYILNFFFLYFTFSNAQGKMQLQNGVSKVKIPFDFHNNLIIFPVEVNGIMLNFILDTGASNTVIFGLADGDSMVLHNQKKIILRGLGNGEPIDATLSENNAIKIKDILGQNQSIYIIFNEQFDLSSRVGKTIHGIIGSELLQHFTVSIDFNNSVLIFYNSDQFPNKKIKRHTKLPLVFSQNKPYIKSITKINDSTSHETVMLIDSGNTDALWLFEDVKTGLTCPSPFFVDHLGEGLSGSIEGKRTRIHEFSFGNFRIKKPNVAFLDSTETIFARSFEERNGSIGNQILNRFKIVLDYPNKQIFLKKNKSFDKEFRYNRAGIELSYFGKTLVKSQETKPSEIYGTKVSDGNPIIAFEINYKFDFKPVYGIYLLHENSPAAKAGLKVNDILISINGKAAYNFKLENIVALFQGNEGKNISLEIERNGVIHFYKFLLHEPF